VVSGSKLDLVGSSGEGGNYFAKYPGKTKNDDLYSTPTVQQSGVYLYTFPLF